MQGYYHNETQELTTKLKRAIVLPVRPVQRGYSVVWGSQASNLYLHDWAQDFGFLSTLGVTCVI